MGYKSKIGKYIPVIVPVFIVLIYINSFVSGRSLVAESENEFELAIQSDEASAKKYTLKEIDASTGDIRWKLTANEGMTLNGLQSALIKDIEAELYKNKKLVFKLRAPLGRANSEKNLVYLFGGVVSENLSGDFKLLSNRVDLNKGAEINAKKGFELNLKGKGKIIGKDSTINNDQTKIQINGLKEANLEKVLISGKKVLIERDSSGDILKAEIKNGGQITLKEHFNNNLAASSINWFKDGRVEAFKNVVYKSMDSTLMADSIAVMTNGEVLAKNNVSIKHGETICYGDNVSFTNEKKVIISGNPIAIQEGNRIKAEKIEYDLETGKVEAMGNVQVTPEQKA